MFALFKNISFYLILNLLLFHIWNVWKYNRNELLSSSREGRNGSCLQELIFWHWSHFHVQWLWINYFDMHADSLISIVPQLHRLDNIYMKVSDHGHHGHIFTKLSISTIISTIMSPFQTYSIILPGLQHPWVHGRKVL